MSLPEIDAERYQREAEIASAEESWIENEISRLIEEDGMDEDEAIEQAEENFQKMLDDAEEYKAECYLYEHDML